MRIEVLRIAIEPFSIVGIVESFQAFGDQIIDVFRSHAVDGDDDHSFALGLLHSLSYVRAALILHKAEPNILEL